MNNINFVILNQKKWHDLYQGERPDIASCAPRMTSNEDVWCALSYLQLTQRGLNATVSDRPLPGKINIVDGINFGSRFFSPHIFTIGCRTDGPYPGFCQIILQQNLIQTPGEPARYMPQWPQPGIIPRSANRTGIHSIGFFGDARKNLSPAFQTAEFIRALETLGLRLIIQGKQREGVKWNDYAELDLVIAVRDIPDSHLRLKPVNKLVNAWLAGVPALMGQEPALRAIQQNDLDYFPVNTPADALAAIKKLQSTPNLYPAMVAHGHKRALDFDDNAVAKKWFELFEHASHAFQAWQDSGYVKKRLNFLQRFLKHRTHKRKHKRQIVQRYREMEQRAANQQP